MALLHVVALVTVPLVAGLLAVMVGVVVHEMGHALAAVSFGMYIVRFRIGGPRLIWRGEVGGVPVEVGWPKPKERLGFVQCAPTRVRGVRWQMALLFAAGPLANLVLALPAAWFLLSVSSARTEPDRVVHTCIFLWLVLQLILAIGNLLPIRLRDASGERLSDGARLVSLVRHTYATFETEVVKGLALMAMRTCGDDVAAARELVDRALALDARDIFAGYVGAMTRLRAGDVPGGVAELRTLLPRSQGHRLAGHVHADFALMALWLGRDQPVDDRVLEAARAAITLAPKDLGFLRTYGQVLVRSGQHAEGATLLYPIGAEGAGWARALRHCARAVALRELGRVEEAREDETRARELDAGCPFLPALGTAHCPTSM